VKRDVYAQYLALRDPRTPWIAKVVGGIVVAYAVSPIDLIPDFVPVLGYVDDVLLLPLGILLVRRLIPAAVLEDARARAAAHEQRLRSTAAAVVIVLVWAVVLLAGAWWVFARAG
jgi:uncharacterized membrane protein YkvA (DUF1232 family)